MNVFWSGARSARDALVEDQHRPLPCRAPLWRLILEEIALLARRIGRWKVWSAAGAVFVVVLVVEVALSSETPGPELADWWRWSLAAALSVVTLCVWAVVHAVRRTRSAPVTPAERTGGR
ncbi:MAG: hypothetical protein R8F63_21125 [Acidimicrobiales bacterium]|nr:hypothetical protein [Acidimicrobiales bacterium]